ncbi:MAG: ATP-binding protein, partial [Spirochaetes bacterium]|nr:ATP-binding protein [Spirochaetota bacterium]
KGLNLHFDVAPDVPMDLRGDPLRIQQVLINLIGNAIKFTEKGDVNVTIEKLADGKNIKFTVSDTGIGLTKDDMSKIFQSFTQSDSSTTRRFGGTGLGLSICKNFVEKMGGSIGVDSNPRKGSSFYFILPLVPAEKNTRSSIIASGITEDHFKLTYEGKKILVAEDNSINREVIGGILESIGFSVKYAGNGNEVIKMVESENFDLVLMDVQMPQMDGLEATRIIRTKLQQNIPIVATTAYATTEDVAACMSAGMNGYIKKPINPEKLFDTLGNLLKTSEKTDNKNIKPLKNTMDTVLLNLDGIDVESALRRMGGNKDLLKRIILEFCNTFEDAAEKLEHLISSGDSKNAQLLLHSIRGAGGNIGAIALYTIATDVEMNLKEGKNADAQLGSFYKELSKILKNKDILLRDDKNRNYHPATTLDSTTINHHINRLYELLQGRRFEALSAFDELDNMIGNLIPQEMDKLNKALRNYDFSKAKEELDQITKKLGELEKNGGKC